MAASLKPPVGAQIYGTNFAGITSYLLGPAAGSCEGEWGNADGGETMTATAVSNPSQGVTEVLEPGGVGPDTDLACPYIPAIYAANQAFRGTASSCVQPSDDVVEQIPTGTTNLYAAAVWVPAQARNPNLSQLGLGSPGPGSGDGIDSTVALFSAQLFPAGSVTPPGGVAAPYPTAGGQMVACTLSLEQQNICAASLMFFLATQSDVGAHLVTTTNLKQMEDALSAFLAKVT